MQKKMPLPLRSAFPYEKERFYALPKEKDEELGCIGHVRIDFGKDGNEFWHTWHPRGPETLNSAIFKDELAWVVNELRKTVLSNMVGMRRFCTDNGGYMDGGHAPNYGYVIETDHYQYYLRCIPMHGDYNAYLTAYDRYEQQEHLRQKGIVGKVSYANGDQFSFTNADAYIRAIREELDYKSTTGFQFETITHDPTVCKTVDDAVYDLYGEENPHDLEHYIAKYTNPEAPAMTQEMTM